VLNKDFIRDLSQRISSALPKDWNILKADIENTVKVCAQKTFEKFDLVSRKEFDAQTEVLERTRKKLDALEKEIKTLEND